MDIKPVSSESLDAFKKSQNEIVRRATQLALEQKHSISHHGDRAESILQQGYEMTARMIEPALTLGDVVLLKDQLDWAKSHLPNEGVLPKHVYEQLRLFKQAVEETLPQSHSNEIAPYIEWMIEYQRTLL
ncbi:MAG: hypothetical protein ACOC2H_03870 [Spirochaetota bacterium]